MTEHERAIIKALIDLDGKGSNQQIYEIAKQYAVYNGKTPNNTIRRDLQQSSFIRPVEGCTGQWEIIPFKEIISMLQLKVGETEELLDKERQKIAHLKSELKDVNCFSRLALKYMYANKNKSQNKREEIKQHLLYFASGLNLNLPSDVQQSISTFDDIVPPIENISFITKVYNGNATFSSLGEMHIDKVIKNNGEVKLNE